MERIYELSDEVLLGMLKNPSRDYYSEDIKSLVDCTDEEVTYIFAILRNRKFADFPKDENGEYFPGWNHLKLSNLGGDFILSGGFKEEIKRKKLMTDNIEASIKSYKIQNKATIITISIASLTLIALIVQIFISYCFINK